MKNKFVVSGFQFIYDGASFKVFMLRIRLERDFAVGKPEVMIGKKFYYLIFPLGILRINIEKMENCIKTAINERKKLYLLYNGLSRIVDPYCFGYTEGYGILKGYPTGGFFRINDDGLKDFYLCVIDDIDILDVEFIADERFVEVYGGIMEVRASLRSGG